MTVLVIDPALHSLGGHHYNAVDRLRRDLARLGEATRCLGSAQADSRTRHGLDCTPTFSRSVYGRQDDADGAFAADVAATERELARALAGQAVPDLLVLPCADTVLAAALARLLHRRRRQHRPRVLLWFLYGPHPLRLPDDPGLTDRRARAQRAYAALASVADVRAWCETAPMAAYWRGIVPFEVGVLQAPGLSIPPRPASRADRAAVVACIGFANRAKGYRLLPDALPPVLQRDPGVRFVVHGIVQGSDAPDDGPVFDRLAALGERVSRRHDVLDAASYLDLLSGTDLLLLPYDPVVYGVRGSGVFAEARRFGIPVIAPRDCSFALPAFEQGWGVAMESYDAAGLAAAILAGLERREELSRRAAAAAAGERDDLERLLREALAGLPLPVPRLRHRIHAAIRLGIAGLWRGSPDGPSL